ncbi:MAG: hypothetical protein HY253_11980 [Burkholderiales bacterium]|nr:hypothetical protein [Burkholderiales bacterium]
MKHHTLPPMVSALCLSLLSATCLAQTTPETGKTKATVIRSSELKTQPFSDAPSLITLTENQRIDVLSRKASWMEVRAENKLGWVKMLTLRFDNTTGKEADGNAVGNTAKSLFSLIKTGSSGTTSTTGARGLSKENFNALVPNPEALEKMKTMAASKQDAQQFAQKEQLKAQDVAYLSVNQGGRNEN